MAQRKATPKIILSRAWQECKAWARNRGCRVVSLLSLGRTGPPTREEPPGLMKLTLEPRQPCPVPV